MTNKTQEEVENGVVQIIERGKYHKETQTETAQKILAFIKENIVIKFWSN